ncbi:hypothetical protein [Paucibacter sp. M5-1]|uniref:hypothetical protein n=1 Tax=Paucibacter sp. M5-1 TaxID=3015998 RepID=UPI0022B880BA|nr:hypothetical protein [Paucibacter sp. M5-1]MCZ7881895.1 hypothetical protein [Paucibacter sp. M5-1]
MKQVHHSFMGQFQAARREVAQLRTLMGESAKVATLTFPPQRSTATEGSQRIEGNQKKKR